MANIELYKDTSKTVEERVRDLLSRMTLREKAAQMTQMERSLVTKSALAEDCIGSVVSEPDSKPSENASTTDWADMVDQMQRWAMSSRLGIPIIYGCDAIHGHNNLVGATIFPHNIGLGATRDGELLRKIGVATALEVRSSGIHYTYAPCLAVCKDPRWGRTYESYSEDTGYVRAMTPIISGLQGSPPPGHRSGYPFHAGSKNVIACAKHFVADGGTDKGKSEGNAICTYEELERTHIKPYLDCLDQGVCTVMVSYNSWNGKRMHSNFHLITQILKEKLGFEGFVISDWDGHETVCDPYGADYRYCISATVNAGIDMMMVPHRYKEFLEELISLVESGEIPISRIDDAVGRILKVKIIAGIFEQPFSDRSLTNTVGCDEHRGLAREAVRKSLVLLKNGKDPAKPFLPLDRNARRIFVTGKHADDIGYQCGGWTISKRGSSGRTTAGTTILESIKAAVGEETEVIYEELPSADTLSAQEFSFAVVAVGEEPYVESSGDRTDLGMPVGSADMINLVAAKVPTLVIMISGRPLILEPDLLMDALVAAWLPGSECGGIADVLFGDYDFEGVLPMTWFKSMDQLPVNAEHESYDPLFPLGFGLKMNGE